MADAVAAFACRFEQPFWADYTAAPSAGSRSIVLDSQTLVETLRRGARANAYQYDVTGITGVTAFLGGFSLKVEGPRAVLTWSVSAELERSNAEPRAAMICASWAGQMAARLAGYFGPS